MKSEKTNEELLNSEYGKGFISKLSNYKGNDLFSLFTSMEDVFTYIAYVEKYYSADMVKGLKIVFGLNEPYGIMVEVAGIGPIDVSIAGLIEKLNKNGYKTLASCSGLIKDHHPYEGNEYVTGYISFEYHAEQIEFVKQICEELNFEFSEGQTYFKPSYVIRIKADNDIDAENKWRLFESRLCLNG